MKKLTLSIIPLLFIFSQNAHAEKIKLAFQHQPLALNYLSTHVKYENILINQSDETGKSATHERKITEYSEFLKEQEQEIKNYSTVVLKSKSNYLKKEFSDGKPKKNREERKNENLTKPLDLEITFSTNGRLETPFDLASIPSFGLPIRFPRNEVEEGDTWEADMDFESKNVPPLRLKQNFVLKRVFKINEHSVAEIDYTFETKLKSTELSKDPLVQQKIANLRKNNISSVSYTGNGKLTFDYESGFILTHTLYLSETISKSMIADQRRISQEILTIHEYAEAMLP